MTDYFKLEAGPELDALVAKRVFGIPIGGPRLHDHGAYQSDHVPHYSTTWAGAGMVVDKTDYFEVKSGRTEAGREFECWIHFPDDEATANGHAFADTPQLAICRAALMAVGQ